MKHQIIDIPLVPGEHFQDTRRMDSILSEISSGHQRLLLQDNRFIRTWHGRLSTQEEEWEEMKVKKIKKKKKKNESLEKIHKNHSHHRPQVVSSHSDWFTSIPIILLVFIKWMIGKEIPPPLHVLDKKHSTRDKWKRIITAWVDGWWSHAGFPTECRRMHSTVADGPREE